MGHPIRPSGCRIDQINPFGIKRLPDFHRDSRSPPWKEIAAFAPDVCVHSAWIATPGEYLNSSQNGDFAEWSVPFATALSRLGLRHFVGIGSCLEYPSSLHKLEETAIQPAPDSPYAIAKAKTRVALSELLPRETVFSWTRLFFPYGPGEHPRRLVSSLVHALKTLGNFHLRTPDNIVDCIYIDDVAAALGQIVSTGHPGVINLGSGIPITIRAISELAAELMGKPPSVIVSSPAAEQTPESRVAATSALGQMGWAPSVKLRDGLARAIYHLTRQ
jgi:dTDP-6-deoxy-L-talose 4-dehydrogenase (NAD+)